MNRTTASVAFAVLATTSAASATDSICKAVAVRATAKTETLAELKRGDIIDAITQYNVNKKTSVASLCSHGGGCYLADALQLTNCRINKTKPQYVDESEISYGLDLIRSKMPAEILRQNDVELKLLDLGMCNACADNAAAFYVKMPNSRCATLVRQGLEGNPTAIKTLRDMPKYCAE
jgi:hypothetical protein